MPSRPAIWRLATSGTLLWIAACSGDQPVGPPPPPPPPAPTVLRWSNPAAWPGGAVPQAGADVTIPAGKTFILDVTPPALGGITVQGILKFDDRDLALMAKWILVQGELWIGTESQPYTRAATITLTGTPPEDIQGMGTRVLGVMGGKLELHGQQRAGWTRLGANAAAGSTQLTLSGAMDWRPGDRIVVASTDFDPLQAEEGLIASVQGATLTLRSPLRYSHLRDNADLRGQAARRAG